VVSKIFGAVSKVREAASKVGPDTCSSFPFQLNFSSHSHGRRGLSPETTQSYPDSILRRRCQLIPHWNEWRPCSKVAGSAVARARGGAGAAGAGGRSVGAGSAGAEQQVDEVVRILSPGRAIHTIRETSARAVNQCPVHYGSGQEDVS